MWYYHVYVSYRNKKGQERDHLIYNNPKEFAEKEIATRYMTGKALLVAGEFVPISDIYRIMIWKSRKEFGELTLPNGKSPVGKDNAYVIGCFALRKVKDVYHCTHEFLKEPPQEKEEPIERPVKVLGKKEKAFIVHGRDETQALRLQKYLTKTLKIDAEMFEDFKEKSGSNTIIEQLEYIKDNVGYAFVIVTPDDLGCLREDIDECRTTMLIGKSDVTVESVCEILDNFNTRARQNVVFEHGLFIGALERDRVCCLLQEDTKEKPSDIDGILYVGFKESVKETFSEIVEKLKKVGLVKT